MASAPEKIGLICTEMETKEAKDEEEEDLELRMKEGETKKDKDKGIQTE